MFEKRRPLGRLVAAMLVLAAVVSPSAALAADGPWSSVDLSLLSPQGGGRLLLVTGNLPKGTKLPAKVSLGVPPGSKVEWAGEIVGTDPSKDPAVQYQVRKAGDWDLIEFTLAKSLTGQVEVTVPGSEITSGAATVATLDVVAPFDVPAVNMRIGVPSDAKVSSVSPKSSPLTRDGSTFYTQELKSVKAGKRLKLSVTYSGGTVGGATGGNLPNAPLSPSSPAPVGTKPPIVLFGALAALLAATVLLLQRLGGASTAAAVEGAAERAGGKPAAGRTSPESADDDFQPFGDDEDTSGRQAARRAGGRVTKAATARPADGPKRAPAKAAAKKSSSAEPKAEPTATKAVKRGAAAKATPGSTRNGAATRTKKAPAKRPAPSD